MTYPDPKRVRIMRHTISLDEYENALVMALAAYKGEAPAAVIRDLALAEAEQIFGTVHDRSVDRRVA